MTTNKEVPRSVPFHEVVQADLIDPQYTQELLNECLQNESYGVFLSVLWNVIKANNVSVTGLASELGVTRAAIYQALSADGNPRWSTITGILNALGYSFSIKPLPRRRIPKAKATAPGASKKQSA